MGLLQKAVETYDCFEDEAGVIYAHGTPLAPISHIITSAQIEVTIDQDGNYMSGRLLDKKEPKIIIPVTENSSGRTSAPCAHPLCDILGYVAAYDEKKHSLYMEQLRDWAQFDAENKKLQAVLKYTEKGTILKDLSSAEVIRLDAQGKPEKEKMMVRWRIECGDEESECWKDQNLFRSFIRYYDSIRQKDEKKLCMVSGREEPVAKQHPKGIIPINGNAKLISANDTSGFTYRGRFTDDWQAATVGYTASQKAHNALRWIVANQGVQRSVQGSRRIGEVKGDERSYTLYGGRTFLCWNPQGEVLPPVPLAVLRKTEEKETKFTDYKSALEKVIDGYKSNIATGSQTVIAAFDAATTGRLSVTYYNEMQTSDFLDRMKHWDETCCWENGVYGIQSPPLYRIVQYAFGTRRDDEMIAPEDKVLRQQMQRLISCRIDQKPIPRDIVQNLLDKASRLAVYEKGTRAQLEFITCAVIRKYHYDVLKEEISMECNEKCNDISVLFGELLAILEKAELDTYEEDEKRETNAMRYQSAYIQRPLTTWRMLEERLNPYFKKLKQKKRGAYEFYKKSITDIAIKFPLDEAVCNQKLGDLYLLGYYRKRHELYQEKNVDETVTE